MSDLGKQLDIFSTTLEKFKFTKPIRLIELFAGYGSQSLALDYLGADYESFCICEWAVNSILAYKLESIVKSDSSPTLPLQNTRI